MTATGKKLPLNLGPERPAAPPGGEEGEQSVVGGRTVLADAAPFCRYRLLWTASMEGSEEPMMRCAVFTTLCRAFRSETEQLPYHTVTQLVRML